MGWSKTLVRTGRNRRARRALSRFIAAAFSGATLAGLLVAANAQTQGIVADRNAPAGQLPILDAAQNGVPLVHIAPPSRAGVSRNQYQQFNVEQRGLILNNSPGAVQTQLGGWVGGNLQLGPTPARIILNEVTSTDPSHASQLRGTLEVAGQRADIVVSNPNGIACDGCGFLNTTRATLATGRPQFGSDGALSGFDVSQGQLLVGRGAEGVGLNATNLEQLDLIARGLVFEGEVWAQNLNAIAGANQVLYGTLQAIPQAGAGAAPRLAIDIKALGGMYANQIFLIATERGLGVNSSGRLMALQGNLELSVNGDLTLKDSYAKRDLRLASAGNATLTGQTRAEGGAHISAVGTLANQGELDASGPLGIDAAALANTGQIVTRAAQPLQISVTGELSNRGTLHGAGAVTLSSAHLDNRDGRIGAAGSTRITSTSLVNERGQIVGEQALELTTGVLDNNGGQIASTQGAVQISAAGLHNRAGLITAATDAHLRTREADNTGGELSAGAQLDIATAGEALRNASGRLVAGSDLRLAAGAIHNLGGLMQADSRLELGGSGLDNTQGVITAQRSAIDLGTHALINTDGQLSGTQQLVATTGRIDNTRGTLWSGSALALDTQGEALDNSAGVVHAEGDLSLKSSIFTNNGGRVHSATQTTIASQALDNGGGELIARTRLELTTGVARNVKGRVQAGELQLTSQSWDNSDGELLAQADLRLNTGVLINQGSKLPEAGSSAALGGQGAAARIAAGRTLTIDAAATDNRGGEIAAGGMATLNMNALDNRSGRIVAETGLELRASELQNGRALPESTTAAGMIASNGAAILELAALDNSAGELRARGDLRVNVAGSLGNRGGTIVAGADLHLKASNVVNDADALDATRRGALTAGRDLSLDAGDAIHNAALIAAERDVTLVGTRAVTNTATGSVTAKRALSLDAAELDNAGLLRAETSLAARTARLNNSGEISATSTSIEARQSLTNSGFIDGSLTRLDAGTLANTGSIYGDTLAIAAGRIDNSGSGTLAARETLLIGARELHNTAGGLIYSLGDLAVGGRLETDGSGALVLDGQAESLLNASATIEARQHADEGGPTLRPHIWQLSLGAQRVFDALGRPWQYGLSLRAQHTRDTLVSTDQFVIGNRYSVRGFDGEAVLLAESGYFARNEFTTPFKLFDEPPMAAFLALDFGRVWGPSATYLIGDRLVGAAAGVRGQWRELLFDLTLGTPIDKPEGFETRRWSTYASATYAF